MKNVVWILLYLPLCTPWMPLSRAQSPYTLTWKREGIWFGSGAVVLGLGEYFSRRTPTYTMDALASLDAQQINAFDRKATTFHSESAHRASDVFWYGSHALPVVFLASPRSRSEFGRIAVLYGETLVLNAGLTLLSKSTFRRPRPYVFDPEVASARKQTVNARASFVSGHTSMTAANTFFFARVYSDYHPESPWKPVVWVGAAVIPAITGYLRVRAGRHYPTDVIAGYALGASVGYFVPHLHRPSKKLAAKGVRLLIAPNAAYFSLEF